ncbi:MAG: GHMP kinase [Pseudomonadota bacterium]
MSGPSPVACPARAGTGVFPASVLAAFAPYRVSFVGGGTDLPEFFEDQVGAVLSTTLDIGISILATGRAGTGIHLLTSVGEETAARPGDLQNAILREVLRDHGPQGSLQLAVLSDLPFGTGMGSSGTLAVAMLAGLSCLTRGRTGTPAWLAETAYAIERHRLGYKVGKQDQYAAAFGGLNLIEFHGSRTTVTPVILMPNEAARLEAHVLLLATRGRRRASQILSKMSHGMAEKQGCLLEMRDLAREMATVLATSRIDIARMGELMKRNWALKRSLAGGISPPHVDAMLEAAHRAGALGAKLLGAGSAGYLMVLAFPARHAAIREALGHPAEIPFRLGRSGAWAVVKGAS